MDIVQASNFPVDAYPAVASDYIAASARAIGCDPSYIGPAVLPVLGTAIGHSREIELKPGWREPAIFWTCNVGMSGTQKSPALTAATRPLEERQTKLFKLHGDHQEKYLAKRAEYDRAYARWRKTKSDGPPPEKPVEPICERLVANNATMESVYRLLSQQSRPPLILRDELAGLIDGESEYKGGRGSDRAHLLEMWKCRPLTIDRQGIDGRGRVIHVPRAAVNIAGNMPPDEARRTMNRERHRDGFIARMLFAMPEPPKREWNTNIVDAAATAAFDQVIDDLLGLKDTRVLLLTPEAYQVWVTFYNANSARMLDAGEDFRATLSKIEAYAARIALVFQLASWASGEAGDDAIDEISMTNAIRLANWFADEAHRVQAMLLGRDDDVEPLLKIIDQNGGVISPRDLAHKSRRYRGSGKAELALTDLVNRGLGSWSIENTATKPSRKFVLVTDSHESRDLERFGTVTSVTGLEVDLVHSNGHSDASDNPPF